MTNAWPLDNRITVALFAGMGGACDGLELAGFPVHLAINHDPIAIAVHKKRHPHTRHLQTDVFEVDPREATAGRPVRILWASPDCTHFSSAKGSKPVSPRRRSLTWIVKRWAGTVKPEVIGFENVPEIATWGPLIAKRCPATGRVMKLDGTVAEKGERVPVQEQHLIPDPERRGKTWRRFLQQMEALGYDLSFKPLICADYGVPTIRKRMFGIMRCDGLPIIWPERTHAPRAKAKDMRLKPWVGAHTIIDWSLPCYSIFLSKEEAKALGIKRPLAPATERRIAHGVDKHVIRNKKPFLAPSFEGSDGAGLLIQIGYGERQGQEPRALDVRGPVGTFVAGGSKVGVVAAFLAQNNAGPRMEDNAGRPVSEPLSTMLQTGSHQSLVAVHLSELRGSSKAGREVTEPVPALMAGGRHAAVVYAFMQHYYSTGGQDQKIEDPLGATTGKARHGLVTVTAAGAERVLTDICMRMISPEEGARAHGFCEGALPHEIELNGEVRRLTKTQKYSLVGNSVPPEMVRLLANCNVAQALACAAD